ncbi:MAG: hypothetical protein ABIN61_05060 [candidate division WOR-3 bacterium]
MSIEIFIVSVKSKAGGHFVEVLEIKRVDLNINLKNIRYFSKKG